MRPIWLLALCVACKDDKDPGGEGIVDPTWSLELALGAETSPVGEPVSYEATLVADDGDIATVTAVLTSSLEPELAYDGTHLFPTVLGDHTITAAVEQDGESYLATDTLEVVPAELTDFTLDLVLTTDTVSAGEPLPYEVVGWDSQKNPIDTTSAAVVANSTQVTVAPDHALSTVPGTYTLTAVLAGQWDRESFTVTPGSPASIDLELSTTDLEVGDDATALVIVRDEYGNAIPVAPPWTLTIDGGATLVQDDEITFLDEGWFTVTATLDGTALQDSVGPFLIDSSGPVIVIDQPARATWDEWTWGDSGYNTVSGTITDEWSPLASATLQGAALALDKSGAFDEDLLQVWGLNVIEVEATDTDGNAASDRRSVLSGDFRVYGDEVPGGLMVRINDGAGGLDVLEDLGAGLIDPTTLDDMITNPAYEDSALLYSVSIDITNPDFDSSDLELDATASGIDTTFTITDASFDYDATGKVLGVNYSTDGEITMDEIIVTLMADPWVFDWDSSIQVDVTDLSVEIVGFDFPMATWLEDVLDFFGVDIDEIVKGYVEDALEAELDAAIDDLLSDALEDFEVSETIPVRGADYFLTAVPDDVFTDADGVTLSLATTFEADAWINSHPALGVLNASFDYPDYTLDYGTALGTSGDFVNQALFALWGGGALAIEASGDDLGLELGDVEVIVPGLTALTVTLDPMLPPVVVPEDAGTGTFTFQMGETLVRFYDGDVAPENLRLELYLAAEAELVLEMGTDMTLSPSFGTTQFWVDVVDPKAGDVTNEVLLSALAPLLVPSVSDLLGSIPLPTLSGFGLDSVVLTTSADGGYAILGGELVAE